MRQSASKFNIDVSEIDIYRYEDGAIPLNCEKELLDIREIRYDAGYHVDGRKEFFVYDALETIIQFIEKW